LRVVALPKSKVYHTVRIVITLKQQYGGDMIPSVSYDRSEESMEAKARWFQSLSITERLDTFCFFTELILSQHPEMAEGKDVEPIPGRIQVLQRPEEKQQAGTAQ